MRIFEKILVVICVFALLTVGCVFAVTASEDTSEEKEQGTVTDLEVFIDSAEEATTASDVYDAIIAAAEYIDTHILVPEEWGYNAAMDSCKRLAVKGALKYFELFDNDSLSPDAAYDYTVKAGELLNLFELPEDTEGYEEAKSKYDAAVVKMLGVYVDSIDDKIETTRKTASNQVTINRVKRLLETCELYGDTSVLDDTVNKFNELAEAQERAVAANLDELNEGNAISDYDLPIYYEQDWESLEVAWGSSGSKLADKWSIDLKTTSNKAGIAAEENGNKYYIHQYLEKDNPAATYIQMSLSGFDAGSGLVFEFDITTFSSVPEAGINIETGSVNSQYFPPSYFYINGNGDICHNDKKTVALENAIVPGQWLHIMIILDPDEFIYKLYVAGQYICSYDAKYNGVTTFDHSVVSLRLSGGSSTTGDIAYDNFLIYSGSNYRHKEGLSKMTDDEKFIYYVKYFSNPNSDAAERSIAYNLASAMLSKYWSYEEDEEGNREYDYTENARENEALMAAVDSYLEFDLETTLKEIRLSNLTAYIDMVKALDEHARSSETIAIRLAEIDVINSFTTKNSTLINMEYDEDKNGTPDYAEYEAILKRIEKETACDNNVAAFVGYMDKFESAGTLSAKERNYGKAKALVIAGGIDVDFINDKSHPDRENFADLISAYEVYLDASKTLDKLMKENNSYKIVVCMDKISDYDTEEEWLANSEIVNKYLNIVKEYILETDIDGSPLYDEGYPGISGAVEYFNRTYAYFYTVLQDTHVAYIQSILDYIMATDSYIEKMGRIAVIERYIDNNEINFDDQRIITLLNNFETCKEELELREADYGPLLQMNSVYFNNLVEKMRTAETYTEQKEYFEQASLYYFNIDASVFGTVKAIEIYDDFEAKLRVIEESSLYFLESVAIYNACQTEDERYAALVDCYYNAQFAEMSYEGVEEAMAEYLAAYNAYMNYAEAVNAELTTTGHAVGSFRSNCGINTIIAIIIKKIFGV